MKSKKLNKLARRGLTAALAGAMVLSMAAPAMAAVDPANNTVTVIKPSSQIIRTFNLTSDKDGKNVINSDTTFKDFRYVVDKSSKNLNLMNDTDTVVVYPQFTSNASEKISFYNITIKANDAKGKGLIVPTYAKNSEYWSEIPNESNDTTIAYSQSKIMSDDYKAITFNVDKDVLAKAFDKDVDSDEKDITITVTAYGQTNDGGTTYTEELGSDSIKVAVTKNLKSSVMKVVKAADGWDGKKVTPNDPKWKTTNSLDTEKNTLDIDLKAGEEGKNIALVQAWNDPNSDPEVDADGYKYYEAKSSDPEIATVTKTADKNYRFTVTGKKTGSATIIVTRKKHNGYAEYTQKFTVNVKDSSMNLKVSYANNIGETVNDSIQGATVDNLKYNKDSSGRLYLDITNNKTGKITATADNAEISYKSSDKDFAIVDQQGNVTVTADQFSFTNKDTQRTVLIYVTATNKTNKKNTSTIVIPVDVAKKSWGYIRLTGLATDAQKPIAIANKNNDGAFVTEKNKDNTVWKNSNSQIPIYNADAKGTEYKKVTDVSIERGEYPTVIFGNVKEGDSENHTTAILNNSTADAFYQMSLKDEATWDITKNLDTNNDLVYVSYKVVGSEPYNDKDGKTGVDVVSVNNTTGVVTANRVGTAVVQVTASQKENQNIPDVTKYININVTSEYKYDDITVADASKEITVNASNTGKNPAKISATTAHNNDSDLVYGLYYKNDDGTYSAIDTIKDGWADQTNGNISVNNKGEITYIQGSGTVYVGIAVKPNNTTLNTVSTETGSHAMQFVKVNYGAKTDNKITLTGAPEAVTAGYTATFTAAADNGKVAVTSDNPEVATATLGEDGKTVTITGVKPGTANITVTNTDASAYYKTADAKTIKVTVTNNTLAVDPTTLTFTDAKDAAKKIAVNTDAKDGYTFTSDNPSVATVDAEGNVTPVAAGETKIVVKAGTQTVEVGVVVNKTNTKDVIVEKNVTVKKPTKFTAKNVKPRSITVTAKKNGKITGFKVKYTPVGKPYSEKTVKGNKNLNTKITGLKKGTTYKVKVQAYRKVTQNGKTKTVFSKNTKVIKVTIKK